MHGKQPDDPVSTLCPGGVISQRHRHLAAAGLGYVEDAMNQDPKEPKDTHSSTVQMRVAVAALAVGWLCSIIVLSWTGGGTIQKQNDQIAAMSERLGKVEGKADGLQVFSIELARVEQRLSDLTNALEKKQ